MESIDKLIFNAFILGIIFNMIQDLIMSLTDYLREKSWLVRDYEEIIYENVGTWYYDNDEAQKKELVARAIKNHMKRIQKRSRLDKLLNKFKIKK